MSALSELVVGIVQAEFGTSPTENASKITQIVKKQYREADIIVLPEYSMLNPLAIRDPQRVYELSEPIVGSKYLNALSRLAENLGAAIVAHFIEKTEKPPLAKSTTVLITSKGELVPVYSKIHLFDAYGYRESSFFEPGASPSRIVSIEGIEVAFAICYDLRFPELFRIYATAGAKAVFVQAGWVRGPLKEEVLDALAASRAHENTMYIVVANQTGQMFTGRSGVYSPWGYKELDLGFGEVYAEHVLRAKDVEEARSSIPVVFQAAEKWEIKAKS